MSVFAVCSALAAAGLAISFEIGRVAEQRLSGTSKAALPFQGFDWKSEHATHAARVFVGLFLVEVVFLPRSWNPFSYLTGNSSSFLGFLVFGTWSGILAIGFGGIAASLQALHIERKAIESQQTQHGTSFSKATQDMEQQKLAVVKQARANLASAAAVAGEWKKFHLAREDVNASAMIRSETEKIWSKNITQEFDKKTMHVVDNAIDMRWREVEGQGSTLAKMRKRNKEKEQQIKEQRAKRAERADAQKDDLVKGKTDLRKMIDEMESLKATMQKLKEENTKKEQEKIRELKEREISLLKKEKDLDLSHTQKLEQLKQQEMTLKSREERFDSGEDQKKYQELSEQIESSKLKVGKFNEEVMMKERQKLEEFKKKEMELKKREEELAKLELAKMAEMPDFLGLCEESGPEDEKESNTSSAEDKSVSIRLLAEGLIFPGDSDSSSKDENNPQEKLPTNEQQEEDDARVIDKCGSGKSLLDILDDDEERVDDDAERNANTAVNSTVAIEEEAIDDNESTASTCLLNVIENPAEVQEERNPLDSSNNSGDSLSYHIQQDIAAMEREGTWNDVLSTAAIGESTEEEPPVFPSPLQDATDVTTNASIPMSPTSGSIFKGVITVAPTSSDSDYMMVSNNENGAAASPKVIAAAAAAAGWKSSKKAKKSLVVSEEAGVEVIAWLEPGQFF